MPETQETATVGPKAPPAEARGEWPTGYVVAERYEVRAFLGRGGNSLVYRVYDRSVRAEIALKVLHPGRDPERTLDRFRREVAIAWEASSSHLVRVFHLETESDVYLTMELMEGGSLRRRLEAGPLPIPEVVRIAEAVLQGLAALHACGAVHRDVTPGNILFSKTGEVKLGDFGLVRRPERDETALTARDAVLGTEGYRSPEQALGKKVGPQSDLYAVGVVLFEILAGRLPHEAGGSDFERRLSVLDRAPDVRRFRPEVPPWLARIVARLLEVRLADRYREAEEVLRDLTDERSPRRVRLRRWLLRIAAALFLVLPPTGVILQQTPGASFSHLVPLEGEGIAAVGTRGEELWKLRGVDQENSTKWVLARTTPGGPRLLALVPTRPGRWAPEDVSTLTFYDPATGRVERRIKLPSAAGSFPNDPPRFSIASVKTVDLFHDGTDEVIVNYRHVPEAPSYAVLYAPRLNQACVIYYAYGGQEFEGAADLDGDGIPELLFVGIDNGWNWVNVVAAVKVDPKSLREGDLPTPTAPGVMTDVSQERLLLWYAVVPRGHLEDFHRLAIDEKRRELTVRYLSGKTWTLGFDGFPTGASRTDIAERQKARRATYEHFREAERLRKADQLDLAISEARAAEDSAKRAGEIWLSEYAERLQAKILAAQGKIPEAEALFTSLVERAEDAPEVAYDAAVAFHLAGDLRRAVAWYEKGIGRDSAIGAGKSKHEFLKGEVLALVEGKRYGEALAAVERFGETYPSMQGQLWLFREYIRWRAGEQPEADPSRIGPAYTDLDRYWKLEFEFADGSEAQELLSRVDRFLTERPETKTEALSLRAELLGRLGRKREAAQVAQAALELARVEAPRSIIARGHLGLLEERARHLGSESRLRAGDR